MKVKRIFFLYGKKNKIRGEHAHKKCSQFFYPILGKIKINVEYKNIKKKKTEGWIVFHYFHLISGPTSV